MEVVAASPGNGTPFHNHDVREWSRLDSLTGVLERARLETDHWAANTANSSHKYNKVVDSRARSGADGNIQQQARRKLEVFQSQVPGGRLQVIKTQTVSSSRWTNRSPAVTDVNGEDDFEDLKLSLNPLDLTSEKSKASVGRSVGRRPPSRSRIRDDILSRNLHTAATTNLHRVSRLCHQVHNSAVRQAFGGYRNTLSIAERQSGDGVEITEIDSESSHRSLSRTKSTSSEDLHDSKKSLEDLEDLEQLQNWRRTSKIRRSLQYPKQKSDNKKPPDLPENTGSVRKIREDLETGRRLSTALRGNNVDLEALDQILKSISNSSVSSSSYSDQKFEEPEKDAQITIKKQKRDSFVTVESIQAVRDRLRRTSSPGLEVYGEKKDTEEIDDGIVTEDQSNTHNKSNEMNESRVKSYIYGMESGKNISGTGSLESRSKPGSTSTIRNEDWFSRRKSYGFEQMHSQQETISSKNKRVESSTDSGICRSTEIVVIPTPTRNSFENNCTSESDDDKSLSTVKKYAMIFEKKTDVLKPHDDVPLLWSKKSNAKDIEATTITIPITSNRNFESNQVWSENGEIKRHSIAVDESKYISNNHASKFKRTSLAFNEKCDDDEDSNHKKQNKKVEFCKTEVHFAADSGRVNIVETDEKPPPTQNFRRRRRNSGLIEDFNRNGLPVLHFGDSSYEKLLFSDPDSDGYKTEAIYENLEESNESVTFGTVTVNANGGYRQEFEEMRDNIENEIPKGILKNKPIKPKPYILGDNNDLLQIDGEPEKTWGVKLKSPQKEETPLWRSTVTVKNTFFDQNENAVKEDQPEFQKLLKQLRPTSKKLEDSDTKRNSDSDIGNIRILSPTIDTRRSSWSVADRIKQVEDLKWTENKGYSTKVNFGDGEATVVENRHPTWPRREEYSKDLKRNLLNKGLVVRIGRNDTRNSKHTVCSKTTTNSDTNGTTTTTKITIDLTPSPVDDGDDFKFPRTTLQSFKSPSLIMNTFKTESAKTKMPQQLEALRKLYDEVHSDSEADKEVHQILMSKSENIQDDSSSVVSGSWSKMRAFKHIHNYQKTKNGSHALLEKDINIEQKIDSVSKFQYIDAQIESDLKHLKIEEDNLRESKNKFSPIVLTKSNHVSLKSAFNNEQLSSPYLVGQNRSRTSPYNSDTENKLNYQQTKRLTKVEEHGKQKVTNSKIYSKVTEPSYQKPEPQIKSHHQSRKVDQSAAKEVINRNKSPIKEKVLRQPRKSEMAYFGVKVSPKITRKESHLSEKPDLVQCSSVDDRKGMQIREKEKGHIYENVDDVRRKPNTFDSSILEELTKAADQILQAVNGYTDEEHHSKYTSDEEVKCEPLDTISETKSWRQRSVTQATKSSSNKVVASKGKLKQTSSNSSIDSISRECRKMSAGSIEAKKPFMTKSAEQKQRKKSVNGESAKARRLQRASSREALLQSHGSSSEDLAGHNSEVTRKPRLVKKTKTTQLTISNGIELKKPVRKREDIKSKHEERVPVIGLPEIRHRTAVSTIRSTAEKAAASREKSKLKNDDSKKKLTTKRETTKGVSSSTLKPDRTKNTVNRDYSHRHTSVGTQKKPIRGSEVGKH